MEEEETFQNKFNMTYTLLQRLLSPDHFHQIKTCEPVIVRVVNESKTPNSKKLRSPGYKHAIVSSKSIFVINTPAKSESDLLLTINMEEINDVQIIYDDVDFLQGDLKKTAQHIQIKCNDNLFGSPSDNSLATKPVLNSASPGEVLTSSTQEILRHHLSPATAGVSFKDSLTAPNGSVSCEVYPVLSHEEPKHLDSSNDIEYVTEKNIRNTKSSLPNSHSKMKRKVRGSRTEILRQGTDNEGRRGSFPTMKRELPKPLDGTETTNASYVNMMRSINEGRSISPSKSCNDLSQVSSGHLTKDHLSVALSESSAFSHSWNDGLEQSHVREKSETSHPGTSGMVSKALRSYSDQLSASAVPSTFIEMNWLSPASSLTSLSESSSSRIAKFLKGNNDTDSSQQTEDNDLGTCVDLYTVEVKSMLFNIVKESWMQSLLVQMYLLDEKRSGGISTTSVKIDSSGVLQKFTEIKEEILSCDFDDQLFLLTKEMLYACRNYYSIKKKAWKSTPLLNYYMKKIKQLVVSSTRNENERMDEVDTLIIVAEFFICMFQDSEMFPSRNIILNENHASFVRHLIEYLVAPLKMGNCTAEENVEVEDLLSTWHNTCVGLLYEIIYAANNSNWNCKMKNKSFDVPKVAQCLSERCRDVMNLVKHAVHRITNYFSGGGGDGMMLVGNVTQLYKELTFLQFVGLHCPELKRMTKEHHQEELKYYITISSVGRIPSQFPLTAVIKALLLDVVHMIVTQP